MFDEILKTVKEHFAENPHITADVPADQHDALHNEIAEHVANNLSSAAPGAMMVQSDALGALSLPGGLGGILDKLKDSLASGGPVVSAIEGGLIGSLASKFGLSPGISGAIAAALPGLLQKFAGKEAPVDTTPTTH